jgi:hypothetical protein
MKPMRNRVHLIVCGALITVSMAAVSLPGGIAAAAKPATGTCSSVSGSYTTGADFGGPISGPVSLSGCTDLPDTGGAGTLTITLSPLGGSNFSSAIVWQSGLTSTSSLDETKLTQITHANKCPSPPRGFLADDEFRMKGVLTGGTATNLVRSKYKKEQLCEEYQITGDTQLNVIRNLPGTVFTF